MTRGILGLRPTVFVKLSAILVVTGVAVSAFIIIGMRMISLPGYDARETIDKNIEQYMRMLADEVGSPPSLDKMKVVAQRTGLQMRIWRPDGSHLETQADLPLISPDLLKAEKFTRSAGFPGFGERPFAVLHYAGGTAVVFAPESTVLSGSTRVLIAVLVLTTFALFLGSLAARKVLKPVRSLSVGVKAVADGRFDVTVPEVGDDELQELAKGFNDMTGRIVAMMKGKQQLLLDVSHELRSPISRMMMTVGLMPRCEDRERLERNLKEMERMISGVLEMARLESDVKHPDRRPLDLAQAVCQAAALFDPRAATISLTLPEAPVVAVADDEQVQVLLRNLIENAVKYSDAHLKPIEVVVQARAGEAVIEVRDKGIGIPKEDLPNVTEPFYRVDRSRSKATGGFGLGLSLCQRIMQTHSGRLTLSSPGLGQGTTATATFPLAPPGLGRGNGSLQ